MKKIEKIKLDNAANIYPFGARKNLNYVHRISVELNEQVEPNVLQQSLESIITRFPSFNVFLRKDNFWFYFIKADKLPKIEKEKIKCKVFDLNKDFLFRVVYTSKTIALETFHSVADGYGALTFFNCLLAKYFSLQNKKVSFNQLPVDINSEPDKQEIEDAFHRFADLKEFNRREKDTSYQIDGEDISGVTNTTINLSVAKLKEVIKPYNYKIFEFLLALYFDSLLKYKKSNNSKDKKRVKISIAINLRQYFDTKTLRNFASFINLGIESQRDYSIDEIINEIRSQMKIVNKDYCLRNFNSNVKPEKMFIVKLIPRFIKKWILGFLYYYSGERLYTTVFSNMGMVNAPIEFKDYIDHYECMMGRQRTNKKTLGCISFNDILSITIGSQIKENDIEMTLIENLKKYGINIIK